MHFVAPQDGIGVLLCPQVVVLRCGVFGPAWLNPAHLYSMNQLAYLMAAQGTARSDGPARKTLVLLQ